MLIIMMMKHIDLRSLGREQPCEAAAWWCGLWSQIAYTGISAESWRRRGLRSVHYLSMLQFPQL